MKDNSMDNDSLYRTSNDRMFLYVNKRTIRDKEIEKVVLYVYAMLNCCCVSCQSYDSLGL